MCFLTGCCWLNFCFFGFGGGVFGKFAKGFPARMENG